MSNLVRGARNVINIKTKRAKKPRARKRKSRDFATNLAAFAVGAASSVVGNILYDRYYDDEGQLKKAKKIASRDSSSRAAKRVYVSIAPEDGQWWMTLVYPGDVSYSSPFRTKTAALAAYAQVSLALQAEGFQTVMVES